MAGAGASPGLFADAVSAHWGPDWGWELEPLHFASRLFPGLPHLVTAGTGEQAAEKGRARLERLS